MTSAERPGQGRAKLRPAGADDAERIARLHVESWRASYAGELSPAFLAALELGVRAAAWRSELERGVTVLLAEEGAALAGFVAFGPMRGGEPRPGAWEIYNLHVSPSRKGQGIGGTLFARAAAAGRDRGAAELVLWVVESNHAARAFYERKGMRRDGAEQGHAVGPGESLREVRYRMKLGELRLPGEAGDWGEPRRA